ncbi:DedA family protein [Corynebacterium sp.]|uniref:DedA family protein n=1 Tax=Corynebacterium sp. TaxID=1720 RepID=UPI0025B8F4AB|nr:DedA family protein [Corynebacterium sp.]
MEILGAPGVGVAIFLESVFPPIPSEVVLPLAGFTASRGELNVWAAFIWATVGSVAGAFLLYWLGAAIGAQRLRQIADRMWLVEPADVDRYGRWSVFFGRLMPGVRSLISIPAGIDRMSPLSFGLLTLTGSALWNALLIYAGVVLGSNYHLVEKYVGEYSTVVYVIVGTGLLVGFGLLVRRARRRSRARQAGRRGTTR